jgi:hypothetical protein
MIHNLKLKNDMPDNKRYKRARDRMDNLIHELNKKDITEKTTQKINTIIDTIDSTESDKKSLTKSVNKAYVTILRLVKKEAGIVTKEYYQNLWMSLGMAAFGVPFGIVFMLILDNPAFIGVGIPVGLAIGVAIGSMKDKKAKENNQQINAETLF